MQAKEHISAISQAIQLLKVHSKFFQVKSAKEREKHNKAKLCKIYEKMVCECEDTIIKLQRIEGGY